MFVVNPYQQTRSQDRIWGGGDPQKVDFLNLTQNGPKWTFCQIFLGGASDPAPPGYGPAYQQKLNLLQIFQIRTLIKQLLTKYRFLKKSPLISRIHKHRNHWFF